MPFLEAAATTCGCRVLCDEDRMIAHRGLFPIIRRVGYRQSLLDKIRRVFEDNFQTLVMKVIEFFPAHAKTSAKRGLLKGSKDFIQISQAYTPYLFEQCALMEQALSLDGIKTAWALTKDIGPCDRM
jgi:hypothetical protein